jgi:hypothetical protein
MPAQTLDSSNMTCHVFLQFEQFNAMRLLHATAANGVTGIPTAASDDT